MVGPRKKFQGRHEELPAVAQFLANSFERDLELFTEYSDDFSASYTANFTTQIASVNAVVYPKALTEAGKLVNGRIAASMKRLKKLNQLTESYVNRAGSALTLAPTDFGCRDLRKTLNQRDVEGVIADLRSLLKNVDANLTALTGKGLKADTKAEMAALRDSLIADNTLKNNNVQDRNQLMHDNIALFDALYATMLDLAAAGKVIHKNISGKPERAPDFTIRTLLKRVRNERKKKGDGE